MPTPSTFEKSMVALSRDVSFLGQALGDVLREQGGDLLFEAVEGLRQECRRMRRRPSVTTEEAVQRRVDALPLDRALDVVRAFTIYFHLINMAEGNHRLRRIEQRETADYPAPRYESIGAAIHALPGMGCSQEDVADLLANLSIRPVFTAHPTESRRMTLLRHLRRISQLVQRLENEKQPRTYDRLRQTLYAEITDLWQTNELRTRYQSVLDEVRNGLYYFDQSVFDVTAQLYRDLHDALRETYPSLAFGEYRFLTFGSWIGGDRDGNPHVTPRVTEQALRMHKSLALSKYSERLDELFDHLTPSTRLVETSEELKQSLQRDEDEFGERGNEIRTRWSEEPYRQKLTYMLERLHTAESRNGVHWTGRPIARERAEGPTYVCPSELAADLEVMAKSLRRCRGARLADRALQEVIWQVRVFGFHIARLDVRQHRNRHLDALDELFGAASADARFSDLTEEGKLEILGHALRGEVHTPLREELSPATVETLEVFEVIARMQREMGREGVDTYIVSFSREVSDLLAVLYLARLAGLVDERASISNLRVVPLFETEEDLRRAPAVMERLFTHAAYRVQLEAWGHRQEIMLGYSDSDKDAGYLTANWLLYRTQQSLVRLGERTGIRITFFHGRGGAIGRGGGPLHHAILGQPADTVRGRIKVTEQGEVLFGRYANPFIARRHLEQVVNAVIRASADTSSQSLDVSGWETMLEELSEAGLRAYRNLVSDDAEFVHFFEHGTPLRSIMRLRIASRPASRQAGPLRLADLRAIPWVFAWTQSRCGLPGWYGLGAALNESLQKDRLGELRAMYRDWPFFKWLIDAAQISLGKADLSIARRYVDLVPDAGPRERYRRLIETEFMRTVEAVNLVADQKQLLESWPVLQRSIELRNPYVDPMSFLQVRAIRELRAEPDETQAEMLRSLVDRSVTGIAAGLQNTG